MMDQVSFYIGSTFGVLRLVARYKPEHFCVLLSLLAGLTAGGIAIDKTINGTETERLAIAQISGASTCVCTTILTLALMLGATKK